MDPGKGFLGQDTQQPKVGSLRHRHIAPQNSSPTPSLACLSLSPTTEL